MISLPRNRKLKVLLTTAVLYDGHRKFPEQDTREDQYKKAIERLRENKELELYCVECVHPGPYTFLNDYFDDDHLLYARQHNKDILNQGVDEFISLIAALIHWKFNPSEMICKLTGRYNVLGDDFFDMIFVIDVNSLLHLESIIDALKRVENVSAVSRLFIN